MANNYVVLLECHDNLVSAAGTAVRFEPGESKSVSLVAIGGKRVSDSWRFKSKDSLVVVIYRSPVDSDFLALLI